MSRPLVSVIIPNYNHATSLPLTIRAVRAQTYRPIEIVFVDDRSTDDSGQVARSLGVPVLSTHVNSGPGAARNLGAAHARGEILFFLDSDVAPGPDAVERAVELVAADPAAGAVCGMLEPVPLVRDSLVQECRCLQAHYWRASSEGVVSFLFTAMCAMRADVFAEIGPFDERLRQTEEVEYGQRLSQRYEIRLTSALGGRHRDDHLLVPLLRKVADRCRLRVPLYTRRRRFARGFETATRVWGSVLAGAAVPAVALAIVAGLLGAPAWLLAPAAAVPVLLLAGSIGCDAGMYRFVLSRRGVLFGIGFAGVQFLVNLAIAVGVGCGVLQWLGSVRFRRLYDGSPVPGPRPAARPATSMAGPA
jgi:glycosyltransferase involved in cell wall biosynthesis